MIDNSASNAFKTTGQQLTRTFRLKKAMNEAIKEFGAEGPLDTLSRSMAAGTIASLRDYIRPKQQSKLIEMVRKRPGLNGLIVDEINRIQTINESAKLNRDACRDNEHNARADLKDSVRSRDGGRGR